jgi:hypothetical protein
MHVAVEREKTPTTSLVVELLVIAVGTIIALLQAVLVFSPPPLKILHPDWSEFFPQTPGTPLSLHPKALACYSTVAE